LGACLMVHQALWRTCPTVPKSRGSPRPACLFMCGGATPSTSQHCRRSLPAVRQSVGITTAAFVVCVPTCAVLCTTSKIGLQHCCCSHCRSMMVWSNALRHQMIAMQCVHWGCSYPLHTSTVQVIDQNKVYDLQ
jgi:hypothetical protein